MDNEENENVLNEDTEEEEPVAPEEDPNKPNPESGTETEEGEKTKTEIKKSYSGYYPTLGTYEEYLQTKNENNQINGKEWEKSKFNFESLYSDEDLAYAIRSKGLVNSFDKETNIFFKYKRFGTSILDPFNKLGKAKEYVFFTKPDLNIMCSGSSGTGTELTHGLSGINIFKYAEANYAHVIRQLSYTYDVSFNDEFVSPFSQLLSNSMINSLDVPDLSTSDVETSANVFGNKISYRGHSYKSDQDGSFSVEVEDNKFLDLYMYYRLYDEYERQKHLGMVDVDPRLIFFKIIHDQTSVYKIVVGEDGETIIYWARYVGCYPTGAPRSSMSDLASSIESGLKYTISYKAQFFSDMDINILADFNRLARASAAWNKTKEITDEEGNIKKTSLYSDMPLYDTNVMHSNGNWAAVPYIVIKKETTSLDSYAEMKKRKLHYYLKWKG